MLVRWAMLALLILWGGGFAWGQQLPLVPFVIDHKSAPKFAGRRVVLAGLRRQAKRALSASRTATWCGAVESGFAFGA